MSLWRALRVAMTLIVIMLLEALNAAGLQEHLHLLSYVCSDSKPKRIPQLHRFSAA
jgi:hypothetical protein